MNVLIISQCSKNALKESRRILDQFAERRGERTWQTAITLDGLNTLRKLLRQKARKNTAVACHWIRGKDHSELMWIVGDARQFNSMGAVPTNTTERDILRAADENDWHTLEIIRLFSELAGLLHDLGKASIAFQRRLRGELTEKNLYRHEWVSLRLFQAFVGNNNDENWLTRLADENNLNEQEWLSDDRYQRDGIDAANKYPFKELPPLAQAIGWLIVTHHRLPVPAGKPMLKSTHFENLLQQIDHSWNEVGRPAEKHEIELYWQPAGQLPITAKTWRKKAAAIATQLLKTQGIYSTQWLENQYVMHLARLSLMLADHHYSSLEKGAPECVKGDASSNIFANTDKQGNLKQTLDEHLLGVAKGAGAIGRALPNFERLLPRIANHKGLRRRSANEKFNWQNRAFDAASALREKSQNKGAFIVNMASTGCGKTLANARILYALAEPHVGMRVTYALGLRTLTLQTGKSYRHDLHLDDDELAVLVGGSASRDLFEYYEAQAEQHGSASAQALLEEDSHVLYEGNIADHPLLSKAMANNDIRKLLSAPMLVCTVDHIVPATESERAGRQIAPMLRLMSSDLILDELDDYDINDLPALTRLVYWAGMLGSRVVLSSATLPAVLVEGMYQAYLHGRHIYQHNRGEQPSAVADIPCLWVDEFSTHTAQCADETNLRENHNTFIQQRVSKLKEATVLRRAKLLVPEISGQKSQQVYQDIAHCFHQAAWQLHQQHAETDPHSGKRISFGLVRMANIEPLIQVAQQWLALQAQPDTRIHLCIYHSRFPLLMRSAIEHMLDASFNRRADNGKEVYELADIRARIDAHPEQQHIFIVLASPVCEVGRDWDADWAIAEPSSMRSLIQLAGRVQRHRRIAPVQPNIMILNAPIKYLKEPGKNQAVYCRPGFEKDDGEFHLRSHTLNDILMPDDYQILHAVPRIQARAPANLQPQNNLVDLEQTRMAHAMAKLPTAVKAGRGPGGIAIERDMAAAGWQYPQAPLTALLPRQQPFRSNAEPTKTLIWLPGEDSENLVVHRVETQGHKKAPLYSPCSREVHQPPLTLGAGFSLWQAEPLEVLLEQQAQYLNLSLRRCAERMASVDVLKSDSGWQWHSALGFFSS